MVRGEPRGEVDLRSRLVEERPSCNAVGLRSQLVEKGAQPVLRGETRDEVDLRSRLVKEGPAGGQ
jgi:hypothetical protein